MQGYTTLPKILRAKPGARSHVYAACYQGAICQLDTVTGQVRGSVQSCTYDCPCGIAQRGAAAVLSNRFLCDIERRRSCIVAARVCACVCVCVWCARARVCVCVCVCV